MSTLPDTPLPSLKTTINSDNDLSAQEKTDAEAEVNTAIAALV